MDTANPPSLLMTVGRKYYRLHEIVDEVSAHGLSKRIPVNSIPEGLVPMASKVFLAHPDALVIVTAEEYTLEDLVYALFELGVFEHAQIEAFVDLDKRYWAGQPLKETDFVPEPMFWIAYALSKMSVAIPEDYARVVDKFGVQYQLAIFGYTPFGGIEVVLKDSENDLPTELDHLRPFVDDGTVEMVHVDYTSEDDDDEE